jgi:hypothetical protein
MRLLREVDVERAEERVAAVSAMPDALVAAAADGTVTPLASARSKKE